MIKIFFEIHANDIARAKSFYAELLGWTFRRVPAPIEYWLIDTGEGDGADGGILARPGNFTPGMAPNAFVVTLGVPDIEASLAKALSLGATIAMPKFAVPGNGWHAYIHDSENNVLGLHQDDPKAA